MSFILVDRPRPGVALVTLNRPERMNAMAFDVMIPFREQIEALGADNDVRVIVVTGAGRGFCSGADLEDPGMMPNIDGLTLTTIAQRAMRLLDDVIRSLRHVPQPVIAAVNGAAVGGGFCLAMAHDLRVAARSAYFRAAGINNGLTSAELGLSYLLPRAVGVTQAADIMLTGRDVTADEAERLGIVSRVVDDADLLDECYAMAEQIIGWSRIGIELSKRLLWSSMESSSLSGHMDHEGTSQLYVRLTTQNFDEAIRSRRQGRKAEYLD